MESISGIDPPKPTNDEEDISKLFEEVKKISVVQTEEGWL